MAAAAQIGLPPQRLLLPEGGGGVVDHLLAHPAIDHQIGAVDEIVLGIRQKEAGARFVTLVVKNTTRPQAAAGFNSDEAASNRPQLVVTP